MSEAVETKKRPGRPKKVPIVVQPTPVNDIIQQKEVDETPPIIKRRRKDATDTASIATKETQSLTSKEERPSCPICCEHFTQQLRKPICCPKCNTETCAVCTKRFLLDLIDDPHCMSCNFGWTRSFLNENLSNAFMNGDWLDHRQQILWRREEAYLPEAQIVAERITKGRNLRKVLEPLELERQKILRELAKIETEYNQVMRRIHRLEAGEEETPLTVQAVETEKKERKEFIRRCPHDNCKGFLSSAWKCGLCENYTCKECLIVRGKDRDAAHECKADDLATAKLIAKDTKFCPNPQCGMGIMRTEGCSQMFCTSCKTAFDWNTMKIITSGHIHNPHYFAYLQQNGQHINRTAGDMMCGGLPPPSIIQPARGQPKQNWMENAMTIYQSIGHMFDVVGPRYAAHIREEDNRDYRVKYLLNDIKKAEIERILVIQERKRERERSIREVIDTYSNVGAEIFRRFAAESKRDAKAWEPFHKELQGLRSYCNEEFMKISRHYKVVVPIITEVVTRYDPTGSVFTWHIATDNANRFEERLQNISEYEAKQQYESLVKTINDFDVDEQVKPLAPLLGDKDGRPISTDADKIMKPVLDNYNKLNAYTDKVNPDNKELRNVIQIKKDYMLMYYNQAWANYHLVPKYNEVLATLEGRPIIYEKIKTMVSNINLTIIKVAVMHPRAHEIVERCKELLIQYSNIPTIVSVEADAKVVSAFTYDEAAQLKKKEEITKRYKDLTSSKK